MFVMRKVWQVGVMLGVVVAEDKRVVGALIMVDIASLFYIAFGVYQFAEMKVRIVCEINVAAYECDKLAAHIVGEFR